MKKVSFLMAFIMVVMVGGCATTKREDERKCRYTYYVAGKKKTMTMCLPECPPIPDWEDIGPCP